MSNRIWMTRAQLEHLSNKPRNPELKPFPSKLDLYEYVTYGTSTLPEEVDRIANKWLDLSMRIPK